MRISHVIRLLVLAFVAVSAVIESPAQAQNSAPVPAPSAQKNFVFEVVAITPRKSSDQGAMWQGTPDGMVLTNVPLSWLVRSAFDIIIDDQLSGLPGWASSDRYDIQAKMDEETALAYKNLTRQEKKQQDQLMLQALLAERCQLKVHRETRQVPVYDLVIAKAGLKMKENPVSAGSRTMVSKDHVNAQAMSMESLAFSLSGEVGRVIIDKTGLGDKKFDFDLKWTPDDQQGTADAGPSIYAALEEQLGLKLVPSRGPVETVVIDRMEKPSQN